MTWNRTGGQDQDGNGDQMTGDEMTGDPAGPGTGREARTRTGSATRRLETR